MVDSYDGADIVDGTSFFFRVALVTQWGVGAMSAVGNVTTAIGEVGTLQFQDATYSVREDVGWVTLKVVRVGGASGTLVGTLDSTLPCDGSWACPVVGSDYSDVSGATLTFLDGEVSKEFNISILDDGLHEGPAETFAVSVEVLGSGVAASQTQVDILADSDAGVFRWSATEYSVVENQPSVTALVVREGGSSG